ncbi:hypothetical protein DL767_002634 [Monosporascus sp. MG133]|nr:hypothetical protein DL767_002634 [Monosporascus sp. MG133]
MKNADHEDMHLETFRIVFASEDRSRQDVNHASLAPGPDPGKSGSLSITDYQLRDGARRIVGRMDEVSAAPSDFIADWFVKLIQPSWDWLHGFRERANITQLEDPDEPFEPNPDLSIQNFTKLEREMTEYIE